eukprot:a3183_8.p3 GENE.a3183_8~~a3183_8.p3  ORF type:complete len:125 (-),score=60.64 a3183_8:119-451(-)
MVSFASSAAAAADPNAHNPQTAIAVFVIGIIVVLVLASVYFVVHDVRGIVSDRRAAREGVAAESSHVKRFRALAASYMLDVDDPNAFALSLVSASPKGDAAVEMADLARA